MSGFSVYMRSVRGRQTLAEVERGSLVSHSVISRMERGQRLLSLRSLQRLCAHYSTNLDEAIALMAQARGERDKRRAKGVERG